MMTARYDISMFQGQLPFGFDPSVMPELAPTEQSGQQKPWDKVMFDVKNHFDHVFKFADQYRQHHESGWQAAREYYNMGESGKFDNNRIASIFERRPNPENDRQVEYDPERWATLMPVVFEATQQLQSRIYNSMFGNGPDYAQFLGREKNDQPDAETYEKVVNYQMGYLQDTPRIGQEWINSSIIEGTGILIKTWDFRKNCPKDDVLDPLDYWPDPQHELQRFNIWRRRITVGDLKRLREVGMVFFTDEDIESVRKNKVRERWTDTQKIRRPIFNDPTDELSESTYTMVTVDILMETDPERWIYVVNDTLIISVVPSPVPRDENDVARMPAVKYSPMILKDSWYGDSIAFRMLESQDFVNSLMYLVNKNFAANALGMTVVTPEVMEENEEWEAGKPLVATDPRTAIQHVQFPDISAGATQLIDYVRRNITDEASGVTETMRGSAQFSNMTATGTQSLLNEATSRLDLATKNALQSMRDYHALHLLMNQRYLEPFDYVRITGNRGITRPVQGADLHGVIGKDIVPTGFPISGTRQFWMQQGPAMAAFVMQTGGNPRPIAEEILKAMGMSAQVEEVYPALAPVGQDPRQENELMLQGVPVEVSPNDDDIRHVVEHMTILQDANLIGQILAAPQGRDMLIQIEQHVAFHMSRIQQTGFEQQRAQGGFGSGMGSSGASSLQIQNPQPNSEQNTQRQMEAQGQ